MVRYSAGGMRSMASRISSNSPLITPRRCSALTRAYTLASQSAWKNCPSSSSTETGPNPVCPPMSCTLLTPATLRLSDGIILAGLRPGMLPRRRQRTYHGRATGVPPGQTPRRPPRGSAMDYPNQEWQRKGATLSDKTARQEFGLTQDEIYDAIDAGTLQYRQAAMHGYPWLRLLRREVEALARTRHGDRYVNERQDRAELALVNREIRRLRAELAALEERRSKLSSGLRE